jgi:crotonobetainyl-CoA:carnitine CoA-transferase CaiB-like acyl-CoA transferase
MGESPVNLFRSFKVLNNAIKLSETKAEMTCPAPELGEHTYEVLAEIGYSHDDIENMMKSGIIGSQLSKKD